MRALIILVTVFSNVVLPSNAQPGGQPDMIQIQFEPIGFAPDMSLSQGANLDDLIGNLFDGMRMQRPRRRGMAPLRGSGVMFDGPLGAPTGWINEQSSMPVGTIADLFPGPIMIGGEGDMFTQSTKPMNSPDAFIMDMLQHVNRNFKEQMLPAVHRASRGNRMPNSCKADVTASCSKAKSWLHCLGQNPEQISEACRKDVGKSVPFVCSSAIDKSCNTLEQGILPCLALHLKELEDTCHDAVLATTSVIAKVNTQRTSLLNPETGKEQVHTPTHSSQDGGLNVTYNVVPAKQQQVKSPTTATSDEAELSAPLSFSFDMKPSLTEKRNDVDSVRGRVAIALVVLFGIIATCLFKPSFKSKNGAMRGAQLLQSDSNDCNHML